MDDADEMGTIVEVFVYDLTKGMAAMMSQMLIGIINSFNSLAPKSRNSTMPVLPFYYAPPRKSSLCQSASIFYYISPLLISIYIYIYSRCFFASPRHRAGTRAS